MEQVKKRRKKGHHYSLRIKKASVARIQAREITITELCEELNVDRKTVRYWADNVHRWPDDDCTVVFRNTYSEAFKRKFVREVEAGELTLKEACIKYNYRWAANTKPWFAKYGSANLQQNLNTPVSQDSSKEEKDKSLTTTINEKELQEQLRNAHLKIALLESMIDVAEQQLNIDIRKKAGAKQ